MKNTIKFISILIMMILLLNIIPLYSNAEISIDNIHSSAQEFLNKGQNQSDKTSTISVSDMKKELLPIAEILTIIGTGVLVICTVIIGIKYMVASPDEQAKLKKQMVGLVVAAIVIFGAYGIWKMLYDFMVQATK